jgi:hypothetical protein
MTQEIVGARKQAWLLPSFSKFVVRLIDERRGLLLTKMKLFRTVPRAMRTRLASLFLLLVLVGGAFAGVPLSFGESHCSMGGMMDMDCCRAMLRQQSRTRFTREEELLCALNCAQNGTTLPAGVIRIMPPAQTIQPVHPALTQPLPLPVLFSNAGVPAHGPAGSPPTYLRNLTLLI